MIEGVEVICLVVVLLCVFWLIPCVIEDVEVIVIGCGGGEWLSGVVVE